MVTMSMMLSFLGMCDDAKHVACRWFRGGYLQGAADRWGLVGPISGAAWGLARTKGQHGGTRQALLIVP
jgi:hypothetical protein